MSRSPATTSRRTAIALALGAPLALTACEFDPPSGVPTQRSTDEPTSAPLPDAEVVASVRKAIMVMVATIETTITRHPRLAGEFDPWLSLHEAHLTALDDGSEPGEVEGEAPQPRPALARERMRALEGSLTGTLADAAGSAASGDLARALASMSAAIFQRLMA